MATVPATSKKEEDPFQLERESSSEEEDDDDFEIVLDVATKKKPTVSSVSLVLSPVPRL